MSGELMDIVAWEGIENGKEEIVRETLYLNPHEKDLKYVDGSVYRKLIVLGNSGFALEMYGEGALFHFYPEGQDKGSSKIDENQAKYASIMCSCLYYLYNESIRSKLTTSNSGSDITFLFTFTNDRLFDALNKLFLMSDTHDIMRDTTEKRMVVPNNKKLFIDLDRFRNLDKNDPLIVFLGKASKRAKGMEIVRLRKVEN